MADNQPVRLEDLNPACCTGWAYEQDVCLTCAMCASACPVAGVDDYDPRKMVRMVSLGMVDEVAQSRWPWICTMCGKCEQCCPMGIDIADITRRIRSMREGKRVPGILHKGLTAALETGNNLSLPKEDFIFILEDVAKRSPKNRASTDSVCPSTKRVPDCSPPSTTNW
jgi:heterodisulfide reductase subunit C